MLADVMTDKATVEIPSPVAGTVAGAGRRGRRACSRSAPSWSGSRSTAPAATSAGAGRSAPSAPRHPPRAAADGRAAARRATTRAPLRRRARWREPQRAAAPGRRASRSPRRRCGARAREAGIDLRQVRGSGPAGRIVHDDLDAFLRAARPRRPRRPARPRARATRSVEDDQDHRPAPRASPQKMARVEAPHRRISPMSRKSTSPRSRRCAPRSTHDAGRSAPQADAAAVPDARAGRGGAPTSRR